MVRLSLLILAVLGVSAAPSCGAFSDGLVGYWQFEEVTEDGDYLDSSGNGLHLRAGERELLGTEPLIVGGIAGNGAQLGSNDFLWSNAAAPISGNAPRTLNVWFMPIGAQTQAAFCWGADAPGRVFDLYLNSNGMWGGHFYGGSWDTLSGFSDDNPRYTTGDWQMTTLVYDGDVTASVYLNGEFVKSATLPGQLDTPSAAFAVGGGGDHGYSGTRGFSGFIDETALWSRLLTADEIAEAYEFGLEWSFFAPSKPADRLRGILTMTVLSGDPIWISFAVHGGKALVAPRRGIRPVTASSEGLIWILFGQTGGTPQRRLFQNRGNAILLLIFLGTSLLFNRRP